jgi:hypothetical protein
VNSDPLSVMNCSSMLCMLARAFSTLYASSLAVIVSSVGTNLPALVNRLTITNIESHRRADPGSNDFGSFTMKSIVTLIYGLAGGVSGWSNL